jgi:hypothetical protein
MKSSLPPKPDGRLSTVRKWLSVSAATFGASIAWGMVPAFVARHFTSISEAESLLFVALPTALVVGAWLWPRAPKILGFTDD